MTELIGQPIDDYHMYLYVQTRMLEPQGPEFSLVGYGASRQKWKQESILYEKRRIFII